MLVTGRIYVKTFRYPALLVVVTAAIVASWGFAGATRAAGTTVPLGTAGSFAVLAGSGITNTGATTLSGDTGSSPTSSETGFGACPAANCVTQTGANHVDPDPNDSATQSAKAALTNAYNVAAGQSPTTIPTELAGQTLAPGVYTSASGTFGMTGTLTLDAANDPDAVFIFQTADGTGTLITGATGNVSMIRSAQSCNVFWKVGTSATLGAGSTFRGTIMAHTSISLGAAVTVDGRLLAGEQPSGAGAVTLINDTIIVPSCAAPVTTTAATTTAATGTTTSTTTSTTTTSTTTATTPTATTPTAAASKAAAAKAAAVKSAAAKKAALRTAAAKKPKQTTSTVARGSARPPVRRVGLTG